MSYGWRVALIGAAFATILLGANGWLYMVSREWASDELHVGKGHSGFPPQSNVIRPAGGGR